jgi:hypothetical protein
MTTVTVSETPNTVTITEVANTVEIVNPAAQSVTVSEDIGSVTVVDGDTTVEVAAVTTQSVTITETSQTVEVSQIEQTVEVVGPGTGNGGGGAPSGPAGGVLGGTYPDPDFAVDMATQAELDAHAAADVMGGDAAGGVLSGTYPDPGFAVDMATQAELDALKTGHENGLFEDPLAGTYTIMQSAAFAFDIESLIVETDSGSATGTISIDATPVTGISSVTFDTTEREYTASANKSVSVGGKITMTLASVSAYRLAWTYKTVRA